VLITPVQEAGLVLWDVEGNRPSRQLAHRGMLPGHTPTANVEKFLEMEREGLHRPGAAPEVR
jgi:hypothetical protein